MTGDALMGSLNARALIRLRKVGERASSCSSSCMIHGSMTWKGGLPSLHAGLRLPGRTTGEIVTER